MNFKRKLSLILGFLDIFVIIAVVVLKSNSTIDVETKDTKRAANVLINSNDALDEYKNKEIKEYIDSRPVIVYDNMTLEELAAKIDRTLSSPMSGKGELIASYALEKGVDPYMATAIILLETGCNYSCSSMVSTCHNVGGQKGSGCGAYQSFATLDDGIKAFIDNLNNNFISKGLTTPDTIGPRYAESGAWASKVKSYMNKVKNA